MRIRTVDILTFDGFFDAKFDILKPRWLPTAVVIVLAGDSGEHMIELSARNMRPAKSSAGPASIQTCRKIERNDADLLGVNIGAELLPIGRREARGGRPAR